MKRRLLILIFLFLQTSVILNSKFFILNSIFAQDMSSQNFIIQGGNFNITSGNKSSTNFRLADVVGQTAANTFASKGYIIQAGFLNSAQAQALSFTVSPSLI